MARGQVRDEGGKPVAAVRVTFQHLATSKSFHTETDRNGRYSIIGLQPGNHETHFEKEGYVPGALPVRVVLGGFTDVPLVTLAVKAPEQNRESDADIAAAVNEKLRAAAVAVGANRLGEAKRLYEEVLDLVDLPEAHHNLGLVLQQVHDLPAAEEQFSRAIELNPSKGAPYLALAGIYNETGREERARALLARAEELFRGDAGFHYNRGVTALNEGRPDEAEAALERALEIDPGRVEALYYLATIAFGKQQMNKVVERLEAYVAGSGQNEQNLAAARGLLEALSPAAAQ